MKYPPKRILLRNYISTFIPSLINKLLGFFVVLFLAHNLGPDIYGEISWALSIIMICSVIVDMGLSTTGIRVLAQNREKWREVVSNYLALQGLAGILIFIGTIAIAFFVSPSDKTKITLLIYAISLVPGSILLDWFFTGIKEMHFIGIGRVIQISIYASLIFIFIRLPENYFWVPIAYLAGMTAYCCFLFISFRLTNKDFHILIDPKGWPEIIRMAIPLGLSSGLLQVYTNFPIVLLGWISGSTATGMYSGAFRIYLTFYELILLFFQPLYPIAAEKWRNNPESIPTFLQIIFRVVSIFSFPVAMGILALGGKILPFLLGADFTSSILDFQIIIWNVVIFSLSTTIGQLVLNMNGKQDQFFKSMIAAAVVGLLANLILIPLAGDTGAAFALVLSETTFFVVVYFWGKRYTKIILLRYLWKPFIASGLMGLFCRLGLSSGIPALWLIPIGVIVYFLILYGLRGWTHNDVLLAKRLFHG